MAAQMATLKQSLPRHAANSGTKGPPCLRGVPQLLAASHRKFNSQNCGRQS